MAPKANKNKTPQDQALAAKRVEFVKAHPNATPEAARQQFFVQTRAAELTSKGVEVTKEKRAQLREKFQTGGVQRTGFYTPGDLARIAARNTGGGNTGGTSGNTGGNTNGQNLSEYKMLNKENTARRPVSAKPQTQQTGMTGINNWINENIAKPEMAAVQRFNERNVKQFGAKTPLIVRTAGGVTRGIGGMAISTGESFNATFINPAVNLIGGLFGRKPNLRQAGPVEAAINTADAIATIGSLGGSHILTSALRAGGEVAAEKLSQRGLARTSMAIDRALARTGGAAETLVSAANSTPKPGKSYAGPKAPGVESKTGKLLYERNQKSFYNDIASGKGPSYQGAKSSTYKPTDVLSTTKVKPARSTKPKGSTTVKPKETPEFFKDSGAKVTFKNEPGTKIPKRVKPKGVETKGGPVVSARASKNAAAQAKADSLIEGGLSKVAPKSSTAPNMNASNLSSMESTAPVTKPKGPKVSPAKAKAGAGVQAKMTEAKSVPVRSTVTPKTTVGSFKNQGEYDAWMGAGGKFHLQNMAPEARQQFITKNQKFIAARGARKTAVTTTESKVVARNVKFKQRYNAAAKRGSEMYPLANKLIAARRAAR